MALTAVLAPPTAVAMMMVGRLKRTERKPTTANAATQMIMDTTLHTCVSGNGRSDTRAAPNAPQ